MGIRFLVGSPDQLPWELQPCVAISHVLNPLPWPCPTGRPQSDILCHLGCLAAAILPANTLQPWVGCSCGPRGPASLYEPVPTGTVGLPRPHHSADLTHHSCPFCPPALDPRAGPQTLAGPWPMLFPRAAWPALSPGSACGPSKDLSDRNAHRLVWIQPVAPGSGDHISAWPRSPGGPLSVICGMNPCSPRGLALAISSPRSQHPGTSALGPLPTSRHHPGASSGCFFQGPPRQLRWPVKLVSVCLSSRVAPGSPVPAPGLSFL